MLLVAKSTKVGIALGNGPRPEVQKPYGRMIAVGVDVRRMITQEGSGQDLVKAQWTGADVATPVTSRRSVRSAAVVVVEGR